MTDMGRKDYILRTTFLDIELWSQHVVYFRYHNNVVMIYILLVRRTHLAPTLSCFPPFNI